MNVTSLPGKIGHSKISSFYSEAAMLLLLWTNKPLLDPFSLVEPQLILNAAVYDCLNIEVMTLSSGVWDHRAGERKSCFIAANIC